MIDQWAEGYVGKLSADDEARIRAACSEHREDPPPIEEQELADIYAETTARVRGIADGTIKPWQCVVCGRPTFARYGSGMFGFVPLCCPYSGAGYDGHGAVVRICKYAMRALVDKWRD